MKRRRAYVVTVAAFGGLVAAAALVASGCEMCCNSSRGRGSIQYTDPETKETGKATFAYRVVCDGSYDQTAERRVRGRLAYYDQKPWKKPGDSEAKIVRLHGKVGNVVGGDADLLAMAEDSSTDNPFYTGDPAPFPEEEYVYPLEDNSPAYDGICSQEKPNLAAFKGKYVPQPPKTGDGGEFLVIVEDRGKPGPSPDDRFDMKLTGGVFDGYQVHGLLAPGGKIDPL